MAHPPFGGGSEASNEADDWFVLRVVMSDPVSSLLFSLATDLANHHDAFGFIIHHELLQGVNERGPVERVTTDTHHR